MFLQKTADTNLQVYNIHTRRSFLCRCSSPSSRHNNWICVRFKQIRVALYKGKLIINTFVNIIQTNNVDGATM